MLEVTSLGVAYGPVLAVEDVSLSVGDRQIVALLGPNGAGKTSTLRAISQMVRSTGSVVFDGVDLAGKTVDEVARLGLIHVPEGRHVFPTLTVEENLLIGMTARAGRAAAYSVDDVYDLFPALTDLRRRLGSLLSGGEQQMVVIGRALVGAPRFLLFDEPSIGLAPIVTRVVFGVLSQVGERTPMLVVEQNTSMALEVASRGLVLAGGRVTIAGTSAELEDRGELLASFLGQRDVAAQVVGGRDM
jgi:branched-chain amino acid transport system ATP-binding protein